MNIDGFLKRYDGLSARTKTTYRNTLQMLSRLITDNEPTDDEIREFLRGFKVGATAQRHKAALKKYSLYKGRTWLFDSKEFTPARRRLPRYLDRETVNKLIDQAHNEDQRMFIKTLFVTGIRIAELMSLTGDNIDPEGIRFIGKGDKERIVPIVDKDFFQELKAYAEKQKGELFPDTYYNYWLLLRRLCVEAKIEMVSPHGLRHSRAVDLLNRGLSLGGVQTFLGHEQPATTLIYLQLTQRDLKKELQRLEE